MFVCVCKALRTQEISDIIDSGAKTVQEVSSSCGAGTDCGSCLNRLQRFVDLKVQEKEASANTELPLENPFKTRVAG
jgi:bacterioferritin-associated ferredoxin